MMTHTQFRTGADAGPLLIKRSAFTLLELMLALSILVVLTSLSLPNLMRTLKQHSVQGNAEQVRQILDRARVRAVEEGRILQFRYEPQGRHFVLLPLDPFDETETAQPAERQTTTSFKQKTASPEPFHVYELAEECRFHVDNSFLSGERTLIERLDEPWIAHLQNGARVKDMNWSAPILYYPDGSATDASMTVMDRDRQYIKLRVRGLTGAVWTEPLAVMSDRLGETGP